MRPKWQKSKVHRTILKFFPFLKSTHQAHFKNIFFLFEVQFFISWWNNTQWKRSWLMMRKFVWFWMILACFVEIDLWDLFGAQILSLKPLIQSENIHNEKYRSFQKFKKVPINQSLYKLSCLQISFYNFEFNLLSWNDV